MHLHVHSVNVFCMQIAVNHCRLVFKAEFYSCVTFPEFLSISVLYFFFFFPPSPSASGFRLVRVRYYNVLFCVRKSGNGTFFLIPKSQLYIGMRMTFWDQERRGKSCWWVHFDLGEFRISEGSEVFMPCFFFPRSKINSWLPPRSQKAIIGI